MWRKNRPELFARLGVHARKRFLIDPTDLPFVLVLSPDNNRPQLRAYRRYEKPAHDAAIAGKFFILLDMIDGTLDGDALFFTRDLRVSGDTEAVVALRNALDDFEGSALDSVVGIVRTAGQAGRARGVGLAFLASESSSCLRLTLVPNWSARPVRRRPCARRSMPAPTRSIAVCRTRPMRGIFPA